MAVYVDWTLGGNVKCPIQELHDLTVISQLLEICYMKNWLL